VIWADLCSSSFGPNDNGRAPSIETIPEEDKFLLFSIEQLHKYSEIMFISDLSVFVHITVIFIKKWSGSIAPS
jgi:hypothetical protein